MMTLKELAILAAKALDEKKGKEISAIEITDITTLADYFVIATGSPTPRSTPCAALWRSCWRSRRGEAPAPGGLPGRYLGAVGLRLHLRPCVQRRGPELL